MPNATAARGYTPNELAKLLRVSPDRIRQWIKTGELAALDTSPTRCGKPRFVVLPHHLAEFELRRRTVAQQQNKPRKKRQTVMVDYFPD